MKIKTKWALGISALVLVFLGALLGSTKLYKGQLEIDFERPAPEEIPIIENIEDVTLTSGTVEEFTEQKKLYEQSQESLQNAPGASKDGEVKITSSAFIENKTEQQGWVIEFREPAILETLEKEYGEQFLVQMDAEKLTQLTPRVEELRNTMLDEHRSFTQKHALGESLGESFFSMNTLTFDIPEETVERLKSEPEVKAIHPNAILQPTLSDSVPMVRAPNVWNLRDSRNQPINGRGVKIGIIDTGVDYRHDDIDQNYLPIGYDFINNDADPMDDIGHGTHVAATAVGNSRTVPGVAPGASIVAYKVCGSRGCPFDDIISAMDAALDPNNDRNFADHLDVVNMSLGEGGDINHQLSLAADRLMSSGVIAAISAGNRGESPYGIGSPGTSRSAITVGAIKKDKTIARFSSRGPATDFAGQTYIAKPDIVAPGQEICAAKASSVLYSQYCNRSQTHMLASGTSMSSPHVAGAAALLRQKYPGLSTHSIKNILMSAADFDGDLDWYTQGAGRLNLERALETPFTVSPRAVSNNVDVHANDYRETVKFESVEGNGIRINIKKVSAVVNLGGQQSAIPAGQISSSFSETKFCVDSNASRKVTVKTDLSGLPVGIYKNEFEIEGEILNGDCRSGVTTTRKFTIPFPVRIRKAYEFTLKMNPDFTILPRWNGKWVSYQKFNPFEQNGKREYLFGAWPGIGPRKFYSDEPKFDIFALAETVDWDWQNLFFRNFAMSILAKKVDLTSKPQNIVFNESDGVPIDTEAHRWLKKHQMDSIADTLAIHKERQTATFVGFWHSNSRFPYRVFRPETNVYFRTNLKNTHGAYSAFGSLQGVPKGKTWETADTFGFFPISSENFPASQKTISKKVKIKTLLLPNTVHGLNYVEIFNNYYIYSGFIEAKNQTSFTIIIPENDKGWFNASQTSGDWSQGTLKNIYTARNGDRFTHPNAITSYFNKIEIKTSIPSTPMNFCLRNAWFWTVDNGYWLWRMNLPGTIVVKDSTGNIIENSAFDKDIVFPNVEGIFEFRIDIPGLGLQKTFHVQSRRIAENCFNRFIVNPAQPQPTPPQTSTSQPGTSTPSLP